MSENVFSFGISADGSKAKKELKELQGEVRRLDEAEVGALTREFKAAGVEIARTTAALKKLGKERAALGSGGGLLGMAGAAVSRYVAPAALATAGVSAVQKMLGASAEEQAAIAPLQAALPEGYSRVVGENRKLGAQFGADSRVLHAEAAKLAQAGYSTEEICKVIRANVVAVRGDMSKLPTLLQGLVKAGSSGFLENDLLTMLDQQGVGLRRALMEHLGVTKQELESAMSRGAVGLEDYFAVIDKVTGEGSQALKMAEAAAQTTLGTWARLKEVGGQTLVELGDAINEAWVEPLLHGVTPALEALPGLLDKVRGKYQEILGGAVALRDALKAVSPVFAGVDALLMKREDLEGYVDPKGEEKRAAVAMQGGMTARAEAWEVERRKALTASLQESAAAWKKLKAEAEAAREAEVRANESLSERRARVAAAVGLAPDATTADVDRALAANKDFAQGGDVMRALGRQRQVRELIAQAGQWGLTGASTAAEWQEAERRHGNEGGFIQWKSRRRYLNKELGLGEAAGLRELQSAADEAVARQNPAGLAMAEALVKARKELVEIDRLQRQVNEKEAAAAAAREQQMAALYRQRDLQEAQLAGDKEAVQWLQQQEAGVRRMAEYMKAGESAESAATMAAEDVYRQSAIDAQGSGTGQRTSAGYLRTSLQEAGGGGARAAALLYDAPTVAADKSTATNTKMTAQTLNKLFEFLRQSAIPAVVS